MQFVNHKRLSDVARAAQRSALAARGRDEKIPIDLDKLTAREMLTPCSSSLTGLPSIHPIQFQNHAVNRDKSHLSAARCVGTLFTFVTFSKLLHGTHTRTLLWASSNNLKDIHVIVPSHTNKEPFVSNPGIALHNDPVSCHPP